ncbi:MULTISPECIES: hypothetical protein [Pseudomonas]|uniref:hypothetical protein n=1 Tax=Pseudomonas TaxID=286 RepID=UPI000F56BE03|nr:MULTISPECIES: hypothetical protein [Pseudomonas]AZF10302.1 hypothetical protein C4J93_2104 [Pseudomonas sp. R2-37-08W]AZF15520.1 hypothetical protein C4J92_2036 [Pseudomonas sp. R3-18-08]AZF20833.1 hypothetical protein C4J91_2083 [Pseudomonas sp. R3-52-08]AZF26164.1 hypothetical protein C4J90_1991 [Pseudomonas sp. R2-60-08W]AZF31529.1 hypothetical protein C4J89_2054 [Pseudomonas sp. R4-35-07]
MPTNFSNPQTKLFYRPIEAALRWCNLIHHESEILKAAWLQPNNLPQLFCRWPSLQAAVEKIGDALRNGELPYGCLGISVPLGSYVEPYQLTIRHSDLRRWMEIHYPDHKPSFLFESGEDAPAKVSLGTFLSLKADRDELSRAFKAQQQLIQEILGELQSIGLERDDLKALAKTNGQLSERSELTYHNIIGALVSLLLDHSPAGKPLSVFTNQAAIVDAIVARHKDVPGLSKRTLDEKFAVANRSLKKNN